MSGAMDAPAVTPPVAVNADLLRAWPLPEPGAHADKESRGAVLVIGGYAELPGAVILAGTAALRAGAGKLIIATAADIAPHVAIAMPEARVIALPHAANGELLPEAMQMLAPLVDRLDAVLIGPGMKQGEASIALVLLLLEKLTKLPVVLDAGAMDAIPRHGSFTQPVLLTPHAGEMCHVSGVPADTVRREPAQTAASWSAAWNVVLALKGPITHIAEPGGRLWVHEGHDPGLGTSGSGDVLAGLCVGLAARGALLDQAAVWAVKLHACAGERLSKRRGPVGYLARELPQEIPGCLHDLDATQIAGQAAEAPALQIVF